MSAPLPPITRLVLISCFVIYALISLKSVSLFSPHPEDLILFGAKVPYLLAQGEWWRLVTPIFLHIGLLHFTLNMLGLKYIGPYFERNLGSGWFLGIFLGSGIIGNIASSLTNLSIGAGASGSLFGLVGVGMVVEWRAFIKHGGFTYVFPRPLQLDLLPAQLRYFAKVVREMTFTWLAWLNLVIALAFNFLMSLNAGASIGIDNAAHLGGMCGGILLGLAFMGITRGDPGLRWRRIASYGLLLATLLGMGMGAYIVCATDYLFYRYQQKLGEMPSP